MGATSYFKVYRGIEYVASCKYPEDAAMIVSGCPGASIRYGHAKKNTVWLEGSEEQPAGESYDFVGETVYARINGEMLLQEIGR